MKNSMAACLGLAILVVGSAWAHHNMSAIFDNKQPFTLTGTLIEIDWRNPHIHFSANVENEEGQVETWRFEGEEPHRFRDCEMGRSDFEDSLNKTVEIDGYRARDGSLFGLINRIVLANGKVWGGPRGDDRATRC